MRGNLVGNWDDNRYQHRLSDLAGLRYGIIICKRVEEKFMEFIVIHIWGLMLLVKSIEHE